MRTSKIQNKTQNVGSDPACDSVLVFIGLVSLVSSYLLFKSSPCKVTPCLSAACFIWQSIVSYLVFILSSFCHCPRLLLKIPQVFQVPQLYCTEYFSFFPIFIFFFFIFFTCPCLYWHLKFIVSYCFPIFTFIFPVNLWIFSKNCHIIINKNLAHTILHQFHFVDLNLYNLSWFSYSMRQLTLHSSNH